MMDEHPEREDVMSWIDGELGADQANAIRAHVTACADCRSIADDLRQVTRQVARWQVEPAPPGLRAQVNRRSDAVDETRRRWVQHLPRWSYALAASVAIAALVFLVLVPMRHSRELDDMAFEARTNQAARASTLGQGVQAGVAGKTVDGSVPEPDRNESPIAARTVVPQDPANAAPAGPLLAKTATMQLVVRNLDDARAALDRVLAASRGVIGNLRITGETPAQRTLAATVSIPAQNFETALKGVRPLGRVQDETQGSEDVTAQSIDLDARLANARHTEKRLTELLANRTGKLSEVLEFEREAARVRGEIERMEAERKHLSTRVAMATIDLVMTEERRADAAPATPSVARDLQNAFFDGVRGAVELVLIMTGYVLLFAPTVLLLTAVGAWPARVWMRRRRTRS